MHFVNQIIHVIYFKSFRHLSFYRSVATFLVFFELNIDSIFLFILFFTKESLINFVKFFNYTMHKHVPFDRKLPVLQFIQKAFLNLTIKLSFLLKFLLVIIKDRELMSPISKWIKKNISYDEYTLGKTSLLLKQINECVMLPLIPITLLIHYNVHIEDQIILVPIHRIYV